MTTKSFDAKKTVLLSALLLELTSVSYAATILVDGTTCALGDAITAANTDAVSGGCTAGAGADVIELPENAVLIHDPNLINSEITINGNGSTVDGDAAYTVFAVNGGLLTINDVTVTNGNSPIDNDNYGGGLKCENGGGLYVNRSIITANKGSGVLIDNCTATVIDSQINDNTCFPFYQFPEYYISGVGGGISVIGGTVNIENSTISNNVCHSYYGGGGISIFDSTVTISNSTISGNESFNCAGGICAFRQFSVEAVVELTLSQVTVISNRSHQSVGGIDNRTDNPSTLVTISQSIIAGNQNIQSQPLQSEISNGSGGGGNMQFDDFNLFGYENNPGMGIFLTPGATDMVPSASLAEIIDTKLADNGGQAPTHALVSGSPAIDFIPSANCASLTDQTGKVRPIDGDIDGTANCDIGAFEINQPDLIFESGFD